MMKYYNGPVWLYCPISHPVDALLYSGMWLDDIYWAGSLLHEIVMILFTQSTAVLHIYLNDELKLLRYNLSPRLHRVHWVFHVQRNPWVFQAFQVCGYHVTAVVGVGVEYNAPCTRHNIGHFGAGLHSQSLDWYWQTKQYRKIQINKLNTNQKK